MRSRWIPTLGAAAPYLVLLTEALAFYRKVLFTPDFKIPFDLPGYHYPLAAFLARCLRHGEFPFWDPYVYCGFPLYANITAQVFYPPTLAAVWLSNALGGRNLLDVLEWQIALHVFLGGTCCYWLLRRLQLGPGAALFGATIFQLGSYFASQTQHLGAVNGAAWLPLAWLCVFRLGERGGWKWILLLACTLALVILAGFPALAAVVLVSCGVLAAALAALRRASPRLLAAVGAACVWAALLSAVQWLPTMELSGLSMAPRRAEIVPGAGGVPLQALTSMLIPNYHHVFDPAQYRLKQNITFAYLYSSLAGLALALAALLPRAHRYRSTVAAVTLLSLVWMLGDETPVGAAIWRLLPVGIKSSLYVEFAMACFALGVAVLAAMGADRFVAPRGRIWQAALVVLGAADLILVGSGRYMNTAEVRKDPGFSEEHLEGSREIVSKLRDLANRSLPPWRFDVHNASVNWVPAAPVIQVPTANGKEPLALARTLAVRSLFTGAPPWARYSEVQHVDSPVLNFLNVRYLISYAQAAPRSGSLPLVARVGWHDVFENPHALPRFFLVGRVWRARNLEDALARMRGPDFDPRSVAVVEGDLTLPETPAVGGSVRVLRHANREIELETNSPTAAFLVTSETYYPGWRAWVDGAETSLLMTNGAFRGLVVPAGRRYIRMLFAPRIFWYGLAVSLLAWTLMLAGTVKILIQRRRS